MKCPKCKKEIEEKTLKCPHCKAKIGTLCRFCATYNPITATVCSSCKAELLKRCPSCNALNKPEANSCRKCQHPFVQKEDENEELNQYVKDSWEIKPEQNAVSQQTAKTLLQKAIKNDNVKVISLSGESGAGKNLIINITANDLKGYKFVWLVGKCTQITQLTPMGFIQDILLTFFNINNYCNDTLLLKRNAMKFFKQDFTTLSHNEILDLLNFLYPEKTDYYENIYFNKERHINILTKVFKTIISQVKVLLVIDNFENMDGMSYEFLKRLVEVEEIRNNCKFIFTYADPTPVQGIFHSEHYNDSNYIDITIAPLKRVQLDAFLLQYNELDFSTAMKDALYKISKGNPSIIEQALNLMLDYRRLNLEQKLLSNIDLIISTRLEILKKEDVMLYHVLIACAILGVKFYPAVLENLFNIGGEYLKLVLSKLVKLNYITPIGNLSFEFKSHKIWGLILANVKQTGDYDEINRHLYNILANYQLSTAATQGFLAQNLNMRQDAIGIWTKIMKQASYIGDPGIYIIAQKQTLQLLDTTQVSNKEIIRRNIYIRLGKILSKTEPETAVEYLPKALELLSDSDVFQRIELLGYLNSCAMAIGNYYGAVECADATLAILPQENELERALIKTRKVRALLKIGNCGQVINIIDNDIKPVLSKELNKRIPNKNFSPECIFENWLLLQYDLAEALIWSGNNRSFEILKFIFDTLERENIQDPNLEFKAQLLLAFANSMQGNTETTDEILNESLSKFELDIIDEQLISHWNLINIINRFLSHKYEKMTDELFQAVTFANNIGDNFTKNILKTLLAKVLKEDNENKRALEILDEQVAYFAKEKIATGVLLAWWLIAGTKLITKGSQFALDVATKALDVASGVNVGNHYFTVLFHKLIAEIYLSKGDFESTKMYIEKGIILARQYDMKDLLVRLYILYGKYYEELALPKSLKRTAHITNAIKMFQFARDKAENVENPYLQKMIKDSFSVIASFCKLNGITLKKNS